MTARILSTVELESVFPDWGDQNSLFYHERYFKIFADGGLFADGADFIDSGELDRRDPEDAGELIGVTDGVNRFLPLTTGFLNLMPYRTLSHERQRRERQLIKPERRDVTNH